MTTEAKLLAATSILPALADYLEDCIEDKAIRYKAKEEAQKAINFIRGLDNFLMNTNDLSVVDQQSNIQIAFRQWCEENFK